MTNADNRPLLHVPTIPANQLIAADTQQTLISTKQVIAFVHLMTEVDVTRIDDNAQLGLQHILLSIDQALDYEIERLAPD